MATIRCNCGACEIQFKQKANLFRLECCCYNCISAVWYVNRQKAVNECHPVEVVSAPKLLDSNWFPNDFSITKGISSLKAFKLFDEADTTRVYCKDCSTILIADHPAYAGRIVLTQVTNFGDNNLQNAELCDVKARHFLKDLNQQEIACLPKFTGGEEHIYEGVADDLMAALPEMLENGPVGSGESVDSTNIQKLIEMIGVTVPDDCQDRLCGGPPTLMQQAAAAASAAKEEMEK